MRVWLFLFDGVVIGARDPDEILSVPLKVFPFALVFRLPFVQATLSRRRGGIPCIFS